MQPQAVKQSFNRAASTYNQYAQVQVQAGDMLIDRLVEYKDEFEHVLDAGCGTGLVTNMLADSIEFNTLDAIDIADHLLASARRSPFMSDINFVEMDFNTIGARAKKYDLIFSNMSLHWSNHFTSTLASLQSAMEYDSCLAFTIPLAGTFNELRNKFNTNEFFEIATVKHLLESLGYELLHTSKQIFVASYQNTYKALRAIKMTGASHVGTPKSNALRGKSYLDSHQINELTYVIGYFVVRLR